MIRGKSQGGFQWLIQWFGNCSLHRNLEVLLTMISRVHAGTLQALEFPPERINGSDRAYHLTSFYRLWAGRAI